MSHLRDAIERMTVDLAAKAKEIRGPQGMMVRAFLPEVRELGRLVDDPKSTIQPWISKAVEDLHDAVQRDRDEAARPQPSPPENAYRLEVSGGFGVARANEDQKH